MRDAPSKPLCNGRLADPGLTYQQRVVLAPATQNLNDTLDLVFASNERVYLPVLGQLVQVLGVLLERRLLVALFSTLFGFSRTLARLAGGFGRITLLDAMGDEIDDVEAGNALLMQVIHRVRVFLAKDGNEHIGSSHLLLAASGGLHVHDRPLNHALKPQGWLGVDIVRPGDLGRVVLDEGRERLSQVVNIGRAGAQHLGRAGVVQQRQQQVLDRDEFVSLLASLDECHVQAYFQFLGNHVLSFNRILIADSIATINCNWISTTGLTTKKVIAPLAR